MLILPRNSVLRFVIKNQHFVCNIGPDFFAIIVEEFVSVIVEIRNVDYFEINDGSTYIQLASLPC